jgi:hypothetical protein
VEQARDQAHLVDQPHGWIRTRFDLVIAILLGLTVMAIAWGAYRAEVKEKDADHYFNRSDETRSTSHKVELQGDQQIAAEEQLFLELVRDQAEGRTKAVAFVRRHLVTPEFLAALRWWNRQPPGARPNSPFVSQNPSYRNRFYERAGRLELQAGASLKRAHHAEERAIDYTIVSVILTVSLFVFGIATQMRTPLVRYGLVGVGAIVLLGSLGRFIDLAVS